MVATGRYNTTPVNSRLQLLQHCIAVGGSSHGKWMINDFERTIFHPEKRTDHSMERCGTYHGTVILMLPYHNTQGTKELVNMKDLKWRRSGSEYCLRIYGSRETRHLLSVLTEDRYAF